MSKILMNIATHQAKMRLQGLQWRHTHTYMRTLKDTHTVNELCNIALELLCNII